MLLTQEMAKNDIIHRYWENSTIAKTYDTVVELVYLRFQYREDKLDYRLFKKNPTLSLSTGFSGVLFPSFSCNCTVDSNAIVYIQVRRDQSIGLGATNQC